MRSHFIKQKIKMKLFLELFLSLLESGVTIPVALKSLCRDEKTSFYAIQILEKMNNGESFSHSICLISKKMEQYEHLVVISEETGDLKPVLKSIVLEMKETEKSRESIFAFSIYPAFIGIFSLILSGILFFYGVPFIKQLAQISEHELNMGILKANIWLMISLFLLLVAMIETKTKYNFPYKFFRTINYMTMNNVSVSETLQIMIKSNCFTNKEKKEMISILDGIREGKYLYQACDGVKSFDVFTQTWLSITQDSGNLKECFEKIYQHYSILRKDKFETMQRIFEPSAIGIVGVYIIILIIYCVVPIFLNLGTAIL